MNIIDRCRGCLYGLAIGDALGATVEFMSPGSFPPITEYRVGGPHNLELGEWTDDTSMAIALADSIKNGWDLNDQAKRYCDWLENGKYSVNGWCFDIGATTRHALERFMKSADANQSGLTEASASGNGGIMRIAPVAIKYHDLYPSKIGELFKLGAESSKVTHASTMCTLAAGYMTCVLAAFINGEKRQFILYPDWFEFYDAELEKQKEAFGWNTPGADPVKEVIRGSYATKQPSSTDKWWPASNDYIRGSGFVVQSLEAALWAFSNSNNFEEAVLKAVNLGEDADTTGAVCGQFAGAYWGAKNIPDNFLHNLARKDMIEDALQGLN